MPRNEDEIIKALQVCVRDWETRTDDPQIDCDGSPRSLSFPEVEDRLEPTIADYVESQLGFCLPPFLRRLYCEVANGGFGPDYGLIGVFAGHTDGGKDIVGLYRETQSAKWSRNWPRWPVRALRLLNWGCGMYLVVDCSTPAYRLFHFEPNVSEEETGFPNCLIPHSIDLPRWWDL